jgi:hypothetical protein
MDKDTVINKLVDYITELSDCIRLKSYNPDDYQERISHLNIKIIALGELLNDERKEAKQAQINVK